MLVVVHYFSRWMKVDVIRSTTSATIIKCLDNYFPRFGVPDVLRPDNGPNLVFKEMENWLEKMGVVNHHTTPFWPRANGKVECEDWSLLKARQVSQAEGKHWQAELNKFSEAYQSTNHSTTGVSPVELLLKRKLTTRLPELKEADEEQQGKVVFQQVRTEIQKRKSSPKIIPIEDTCTRRKTDLWAEEMQFCLKKGKRISFLRHMKASLI